ncbi:MAG TPA: hypothetical protein VGI45_33900, partial [Terracidiphilus sp.]
AALEFIQHHLAKSGHVCLLVTTTYPSRRSNRRPTPQRPPRSGLVQTGLWFRFSGCVHEVSWQPERSL